jgi:membrane protein DedA with SNARE-associated domain
MHEIINFILQFADKIGYLGVYIYMFLVGTFIPIPSELILLPSGYLASIGQKSYFITLLVGSLGSLSGALFNYHFAKFFIKKYKNKPSIKKVISFFNKHGKISVFLAPLTPGLGQYISLPAGISHMPLKYFIPLTYTANIIWVNFMLLVGYMFGEKEGHSKLIYVSLGLLAFVIVAASIYVFKEVKKD